ncbi:hypothetical protein RRG08_025574 [Elysia crispata]|uniref:Uncharacterized protein n=1 Tax=Elysia crispata TaxID=231223 RepID=A0AAE1D743_9GAST|nr:hypothetical protein RRG08_025574 [Elysia crispata]
MIAPKLASFDKLHIDKVFAPVISVLLCAQPSPFLCYTSPEQRLNTCTVELRFFTRPSHLTPTSREMVARLPACL